MFDIEVEETHNFFAEGVLVQNCASMWGHDFRPAYGRLIEAIEKLGRPPIVALTATATHHVRLDIVKLLGLRNLRAFVSSFARPNLHIGVLRRGQIFMAENHIVQIARSHQTGIVYCATRADTQSLASFLSLSGLSVGCYHAGLPDKIREEVQNKFACGEFDIAVATNAFGMGIDRQNLRFVIHYSMPGSIEAYYQEIGRAGRDGDPATCLMIFSNEDVERGNHFMHERSPNASILRKVYRVLLSRARLAYGAEEREWIVVKPEVIRGAAFSMGDERRRVSPAMISAAIAELEKMGAIKRERIPGENTKRINLPDRELLPEQLKIDEAAIAVKIKQDQARLDAISGYSNTTLCRQQFILQYFGESSDPCGHCDNCKRNPQK